ncbi:MAG: hypothetical protein KKA73_07340 [Chloroflexi bacterium]|nr:hypothetical protein [Chloroflexota bacterium]MBU1747485.1 hypothetical protein [Chloroflexota bacterium]
MTEDMLTAEEHDLEPIEPTAEPVPAVEPEPSRALVPVETPPSTRPRWQNEWEALHPALRAALTCWPAILIFAILALGSLGILTPFLYLPQLVVYGCAGALAVRWARQQGRADTPFGIGLLAGITLAGLDILTYFCVNVLVGVATGGLGLVSLCCMAGCAPLDAAISTLVAGLGAIIYDTMAAPRR